jgi:flotillin
MLLVKYGKVGEGNASQVIHGGATFVWPVFQQYSYLNLTPMTIDINLKGALTKQNIRVDVPSRFTIGISTERDGMTNAAERLLGMAKDEIEELAKDIIYGQLRATIATMDIEEINADREGFEEKVMANIEAELKKVGLRFINVNISDIQDESGYIKALGEKAASQATNQAKVEVAQQDQMGSTGEARADQQKRIDVAEAEAAAKDGENLASVKVANSISALREAEARAKARGDVAEATETAKAQETAYVAEQKAETARAEVERARRHADVVVPAEIAKLKQVTDADAAMEEAIREGRGRGQARQAELEGEAAGIFAILRKKADGFKAIVDAAGGDASKAAVLLIVEQLPEIAKLQAQAISNISFDKVVVMDGGKNGNGKTATADWLSGMVGALPGLHEVAATAGIQLPDMLGKMLLNGTEPVEDSNELVVRAEDRDQA